MTPNDFWLVLETFKSEDKATEDASDYTIHGTVYAQQAHLALNNPILTLVPSSPDRNEVSESAADVLAPQGFKALQGSLPCDVHLLSFRTMKLKPPEALAILHRRVCRYSLLSL